MFFEIAANLYEAFLHDGQRVAVPKEYIPITEQVLRKVGWHAKAYGIDCPGRVATMPENNKALVALSGGLDSVYLMHKLKEQGYDVTAVHVEGLNKSSAKFERNAAQQSARAAGVPLKVAKFKAPQQTFPDNPFKNQLVLSIMLDIGVKSGVYRFAVGSDWTTPLAEAVTGFTITDSIEVNREYWAGVKQRFPQAELLFIPDNEKKVARLAYLYDKGVLGYVSSCVAPLRFRESLHQRNQQKYHVLLLNGRCGSCYKCAMEYILLAETGRIRKDPAFYEHCFDTLATSKTAHRPDLFSKALPKEKRLENLLKYGS